MPGFDNSIVIGDGIDLSGDFPPENQLDQDGKLLIGSSSGNPGAAVPTSTDSTLNIVTGDGTLDFQIGSGISDNFIPSKLTTKGDLLTWNGGDYKRFPVGTDGHFLSADSTQPSGLLYQSIAGSAMERIGNSTYYTIQHLQDIFHSAGYTSGGLITDAGGGNIDVAAGTGLIRASNDATAILYWFDWPAVSGTAIPSDSVRYIGIEYNGGTPQVTSRSTYNFNFQTDFPIGRVVNEGGTLHIENAPHAVGDHAGLMIRRAYETMPFSRDKRNGGIIIGETGTRNITVTSGAVWERLERFTINAFDTSGGDTFDSYYRDGLGDFTKVASQTQWPNEQYDDGSGVLQTLAANRYANLWFYLELDNNLIMVYGRGQYTSLASAEEESPPSTLPTRIFEQGFLIGRIVFQKSDATAQVIQSAFESILSGAQVSDHGSLSGLTDDDHTQYLLADGTRALSGAWNMGNQALTNVNIDSGTITGITDLTVSDGGTGASSFTAYAVLCGGTTSTNPFQSIAGLGSSGQVLTSNGAGALPSFQNASLLSWNVVTGTSQAISVSNGYIANHAVSVIDFTLPATANEGDSFKIVGRGAGLWKISQNAGQTIYYGDQNTTTGVGGSLDAINNRDSVEVVCVNADVDFQIVNSQGNLTVT